MSAALIDGVRVIPLKKLVNERGHLMEVQRIDDSHFPGYGQSYVTATHPGVIKAWYRHHRQIDQIAVVKGALLLVLFDAREDSPTRGVVQQVALDDRDPVLVQVPVEIWHGFQARGNEDAYLLHLNTLPFQFEDADEDRLSPSDPSIPWNWSA